MPEAAPERKIHVRLSPDLHRRLRVCCAELDTTIQDYVVGLLERELGGAGHGNRRDRSARHRPKGRHDE